MGEALAEAESAANRGEVPVGAVITRAGEIIARAGNQRQEMADPTSHAEIVALRAAGRALGDRVSPAVQAYVRDHELYRDDAS